VSYEEFHGLNSDVRAALVRAGFVVVVARPASAKPSENDEYFNVIERINRGDFNGAEFVLSGRVVDISVRDTKENIQGSSDVSYRLDMSMMAEFSLINTDTLIVLASFVGTGRGADMYLGKDGANFKPDRARIVKELFNSFSEDVKKKLFEQLPSFATTAATKTTDSAAPPSLFGEKSGTLKVYKGGDVSESPSVSDRNRQTEEFKVYRK